MVTDAQFYLMIGVPILFNTVQHGDAWPSGRLRHWSEQRPERTNGRSQSRMLNLENTIATRFDLLIGSLIEPS